MFVRFVRFSKKRSLGLFIEYFYKGNNLGRDGHITPDTSPDEVKTTVSQIILTALKANPALHKLSEDILSRITDYVPLDYGSQNKKEN